MDVPQEQAHDYPPRLYAEGDSNLENKVMNHNCHMGDLTEAIRHDVWDHLKKFSVGINAKLADRKFLWSGRTVHYLLYRHLRVYKKEIWSLVVDRPIRFSLHEFGDEELNVPHGMGSKLDELRPALEVCRSWTFEKRKWLGLLFLQAMGLYDLYHNSRIPFESAKRVFDDEAMMTYPWGRSVYEVFVNSIKMLSPQGRSYTINGLKDVLQVWTYEYVSCFGERFGRVVNEEEITLFRWGGKRTHVSFATVISEEIIDHGVVSYFSFDGSVMKESLQEQFSQWSDEGDDPQLVFRSFWDVQRNENKKRTKSEVSSAVEAPMKKQKKEKKKENAEGKVATEETTIAALKSIMINLYNISRKVDNYDDRYEIVDSRLTVYDFNIVDLAQDISNIDNNIGDRVKVVVGKPKQKEDEEVAAKKKEAAELKRKHAELKKQAAKLQKQKTAELSKQKAGELKKQKTEVQKDALVIRRTRDGVIRIYITQKKHIQEDNELVDVTDDHVALQNEMSLESDVDSCSFNMCFSYTGDNGTTCMRKDIEPSKAIYDPIAPADPVKIDKLMQHLQSFKYGPLHHLSKGDPIPFWSKRIAFIDSWYLGVWVHDYQQFKLKPRQFTFKSTGYEELINDRILIDVQTNLKWLQDVDHLYGVINIGGDHWVGFDVDLLNEKIDCYDSIIGQVIEESEQKVMTAFRSLIQVIHTMMSEVIPASIRKPSFKQFAFRGRKDKYIPQNDIVGDSLGVTFDGISDQNIQASLENSVNAILNSADWDNLPVLNLGPGALIDQTNVTWFRFLHDLSHNILDILMEGWVHEWPTYRLIPDHFKECWFLKLANNVSFQNAQVEEDWVHGGEKPKWMLTSVWLDLVDMFEEFGPDNFGFRM
ncbi:hypothetical protein N665_0725s0008 [Sinapis alba]|nr:hypothetical protein N665_0725s0008 [Sinapis alba]